MEKHLDTGPVVERAEQPLAPPLPDLSGVDLRTLRHMDTPALSAAVAHMLRGPGEGSEFFSQNGSTCSKTGTESSSAGRHGD